MRDIEAAALEALRTYARAIRAYHAVVDAGASLTSQEYIDAANVMDEAESALIDAAQPLLEG